MIDVGMIAWARAKAQGMPIGGTHVDTRDPARSILVARLEDDLARCTVIPAGSWSFEKWEFSVHGAKDWSPFDPARRRKGRR